MDTKRDLDISRFVPLGFELVAIRIKANKFSILYIVNKRTQKSTIVKASNKYCTKIDTTVALKYQYKK